MRVAVSPYSYAYPGGVARHVETVAQLSAWALQWLACYTLPVALGLDATAASVVRRPSSSPSTRQARCPPFPPTSASSGRCASPCSPATGIDPPRGLAYGIILQALELATAVAFGAVLWSVKA